MITWCQLCTDWVRSVGTAIGFMVVVQQSTCCSYTRGSTFQARLTIVQQLGSLDESIQDLGSGWTNINVKMQSS